MQTNEIDITAQAELTDDTGVAAMFGCSSRTVQRIAAAGHLPRVKLPGSRLLRFRRSTVRALCAAWETHPGNWPFDDGAGKVAA